MTLCAALVFFVQTRIGLAQIAPAVVQGVPVDVVDFVLRRGSCHVEPRKAMGLPAFLIFRAVQPDLNVPMRKRPDGPVNANPWARQPSERSRFRVVMDKRLYLRYIQFVHINQVLVVYVTPPVEV